MPNEPVSQSHLSDFVQVGMRVVLRSRLPEAEVEPGGPTLTDTVGDVVAVDAGSITVSTRRGDVAVPRAGLAAAKQIPPAPPRRRPRPAVTPTPPPHPPVTASSPSDGEIPPSLGELTVTHDAGAATPVIDIDALQTLMTAGMPPLHTHPVGDWLLRAADGYTGRANSALPVGDPGMPLEEAVERVITWYDEHGQPALIQLPHAVGIDPERSVLGSLLAGRNWRFFTRTLVMTKRTSRSRDSRGHRPPMTASSPSDGEIPPSLGDRTVTRQGHDGTPTAEVTGPVINVESYDEPTDDWWRTASPRSLEHKATLTKMLARVPVAAYLTAYRGEVPVGHARVAFTEGWAGIFDVHTEPTERRSGVAKALMAGADAATQERPISLQYLQVAAENSAAVRLYESLGWHVHHAYHYATRR